MHQRTRLRGEKQRRSPVQQGEDAAPVDPEPRRQGRVALKRVGRTPTERRPSKAGLYPLVYGLNVTDSLEL